MTTLDAPTAALVRLAARIGLGGEGALAERARALLELGAPRIWGDELLLQSILMVGYPRSLVAAGVWRHLVGLPADAEEDGTDWAQLPSWRARGEDLCRTIYGANYEKLRRNVADLHPAIDGWMVVEGYGRTLARPGLDLVRRELCVIAQVTVLRAERQLHSHLRGALHAGAGRPLVDAALEAIRPEVGDEGVAFAGAIWAKVGG
ncbi:MAG: carboxymuconolactone decarboxylase family protein [Gemmatimonadales bacterium]